MNLPNSYVYFVFQGDNFDPAVATIELGISPTDSWKTGDPGKNIHRQKYSCWELRSTSNEPHELDKLVNEVVTQLSDKIEVIKSLKERHNLISVLEIVMYIDMNEEQSTPSLGHNSEVINFLHETGTTTDIDIYRYNSADK